jgi:CheY-like chemotaxis protein
LLRIAIVEDMDDSREMIRALLELKGHQVTTAADGASGIALLTSDPPDFAIVDIGLPDVSGYEVARRVRQIHAPEHVRLVALTGYGQPTDVEEALRAGFDEHVVKPIDLKCLDAICETTAQSLRQRG